MASTSAWESAIKVSSGIRISRSDDRTYAFSTLGNGLRVLVISEPKAEFAAAAIVAVAGGVGGLCVIGGGMGDAVAGWASGGVRRSSSSGAERPTGE